MARYDVIATPNGSYTIKDVPIFTVHTDRGFNCDASWMQDAIKNFTLNRDQDYLPPVILGHNVKGVEKEAVGFIDNLKLRGKQLYADLVKVPKWLKEKIVQNAYPSRSVEILPKSKRILALALLGGTTPHFALPQMAYKESNEQSQWFRSPNMSFNDTEKAELFAMIQQAVGNGSDTDAQNVETNYELSNDDIIAMMQSGQVPDLYEDEETGRVYALGEDGQYYGVADWAAKAWKGAKERGAKAWAGAKTAGAKAAAHAKTAAAQPGKFRSGFRNETVPRTGQGAAFVAGQKIKRAGSHINARVKERPWNTAALAGVAGLTAGTAAERAVQKRKRQKYSLDGLSIDDQNMLYDADGTHIGEVIPTADVRNAIPEMPDGETPDLDTGSMDDGSEDSLTQDPGMPSGDNLQLVDREGSDQFANLDPEQLQYLINEGLIEVSPEQQAQYDLQREVAEIRQERDTEKSANRAAQLQKYLLTQKKCGAPVGDIDVALNYLLTQTEEQIDQFKQMLEKQPKIQLGTSYALETPNIDTVKRAAVQEYSMNREQYDKLGVKAEDLQFADFVRVDSFVRGRK
jgi:hypothetical protein